MKRREAVALFLGGLASPLVLGARSRTWPHPPAPDFAALERGIAGRLGVAVLDTATGHRVAYRAHERFPMCSTFKWLLAAHVLSRVDAREERLTRMIPYAEADLLEYAPITRARVREGGMTVAELAAAAVQASDNTAANLLLRTVGGSRGLTSFLRRSGDAVSRLDRIEPDLNSAERGDVRDTTTPSAMLADLDGLLLGEQLAVASRAQLLTWLVGCTTGAARLRAGVPREWRVGDKTGTGAHGATSDVAIMWPHSREPVLVAAYLTETDASIETRNGVLAAVGRAVATWLSDA